jgi:hypothetical protein
MKALLRGAALAATLALALGASGCRGTYLEVRFLGEGLSGVTGIRVRLTLMPPNGAPQLMAVDTVRPGGGREITFPTSMAFSLDDVAGNLLVAAEALSATDSVLASGSVTTTIRHAKTWGEVIDFTGGGGGADAGTGGFVVTDGSIADGMVGCAAGLLHPIDSVSLDYDTSGPNMQPGNFLWARAAGQQNYIGWLKFTFNVRDLPGPGMRSNLELMSATLNLTNTGASTMIQPRLQVQYSMFDSWTRPLATAGELVVAHPLSEVIDGSPAGLNRFPLFVTTDRHDWRADLIDGNITIGIDNVLMDAPGASNAEFYGVDPRGGQPLVRPTLDVVICRR